MDDTWNIRQKIGMVFQNPDNQIIAAIVEDDVLKEPIPVVPAQHYHMGGIKVNLASRTSMNDLYAVGEASCNGVHGKNRLASNSLLESLVFAQRAADDIVYGINHVDADVEKVDMSAYDDLDSVFAEYKENIFGEMERERTNND